MRHAAVLTALLLATTACGGGTATPSPSPSASPTAKTYLGDIGVGALFPLSGAAAGSGRDALQGVELAADVLDGIYPSIDLPRLSVGRMVLHSADTQGDAGLGVAGVDRLVGTEHVVALTGALQSPVTSAASQRAEGLGVPFVTGSASATGLTERGYRWFWRVGPSDRMLVETYFRWLKSIESEHPVRKMVVFQEDDATGIEGTRTLKELATSYGIDITEVIVYPVNAADLTSQVLRLRGYAPDALFVFALTRDAALLLSTMAQVGYTPPAVLGFGGGFADPLLVANLGRRADGAITRAAWTPEVAQKNPTARQVAAVFRARYGHEMTEDSARDFEAIMALGAAIERADSVDPAVLREALRRTEIGRTIMPWNGIRFDERGQNPLASGVVEQLSGGEYHLLYPAGVATTRVVWPLPTLTGR